MNKGMSRRIRDALITILSVIQYNGEDAFTTVVSNTADSFDSYPAVRLLPNNLMSVPADNVDQDHTVSFIAIVYWPLEDPTVIEGNLYDQMLDITDLITDMLEVAEYSRELSQVDPAIQDWLMTVKESQWLVAGTKGSASLKLLVNIEVSYSKSLT